jgi:hypothetical protein
MSLKVLTGDYLLSDVNGLGPGRGWFPRIVAEAFLGSTKDGPLKLSPDPVIMINGDLTWANETKAAQRVWVIVHRAPRTVVVQSPSTVVIHDAWSWRIGKSPTADFPTVTQDTFGGRMQIDRSSTADDFLMFGRYFLDGDDTHVYVDAGKVPAGQSLHFRYLAAVQTPGAFTTPTQFDPRWEAHARYARLVALASPLLQEP